LPVREQTHEENTLSAQDAIRIKRSSAEVTAGLIQELIEPGSWGKGGGSIRVYGDQLIIRQKPSIHRRITRLLAKLESSDIRRASGGGYF
jgi:hypothetical protein